MNLEQLLHRNQNGRHATAKKIAWTAGAAGTAVAARAGLPALITQAVNYALKKIPGYRGHLDHIEIHLFRGEVVLQGLTFNQIEGFREIPLLRLEALKARVRWKLLMQG